MKFNDSVGGLYGLDIILKGRTDTTCLLAGGGGGGGGGRRRRRRRRRRALLGNRFHF
jgi:hypothetical protein